MSGWVNSHFSASCASDLERWSILFVAFLIFVVLQLPTLLRPPSVSGMSADARFLLRALASSSAAGQEEAASAFGAPSPQVRRLTHTCRVA
jgi:hypothetical protein